MENYAINVRATIDNVNKRLDAYENAIIKSKNMEQLNHVLEGFNRLTEEWAWVADILLKDNDFSTQCNVLLVSNRFTKCLKYSIDKLGRFVGNEG